MMKLKQLWQQSLIWWLAVGTVLSLIYRPGWLFFSLGVLGWVVLLYLTARGVFWTYLSLITFNPLLAEQFLLRAIKDHPFIARPYTSLGGCYVRAKRWSEAVTLLEQATQVSSPLMNRDIRALLAMAYRENGNSEKALAVLQELLTEETPTLPILVNLALTYITLNEFPEALEAAGYGRVLDPKATEPVLLMGRIHFTTQEFQKAKEDFEWAIHHIAWPVESYYWLGRVEFELGEIQNAVEHFETALIRISEDPLLSDVPAVEAEKWLNEALKKGF